MKRDIFLTQAIFDGDKHLNDGPYVVIVEESLITEVIKGTLASTGISVDGVEVYECGFLMPGLVEAHCHLFLEGGELDFGKRRSYLKSDRDTMLAMCRDNVARAVNYGISLIRDAGDIHGLNQQIRLECRCSPGYAPIVRSPGAALRKTKRYGSFMAIEVENAEEIEQRIRLTRSEIDDLKILLTGIIDFDQGAVKGVPQFNLEELQCITDVAKELAIKTFAHCSGVEGLNLATATGVDSIEHGFFMQEKHLFDMLEKGISWVPTYSPVHIQWAHPELADWSEDAVGKLRAILDNHLEQIRRASELGVSLIAGSDAGSYGVVHGRALIDELYFFAEAGLATGDVLKSATSEPRRKWNHQNANIWVGNTADFLLLDRSPFEDISNIEGVQGLYNGCWSKRKITKTSSDELEILNTS